MPEDAKEAAKKIHNAPVASDTQSAADMIKEIKTKRDFTNRYRKILQGCAPEYAATALSRRYMPGTPDMVLLNAVKEFRRERKQLLLMIGPSYVPKSLDRGERIINPEKEKLVAVVNLPLAEWSSFSRKEEE